MLSINLKNQGALSFDRLMYPPFSILIFSYIFQPVPQSTYQLTKFQQGAKNASQSVGEFN